MTCVLTSCHRLPFNTHAALVADQHQASTLTNAVNDKTAPSEFDELDELDELDQLEELDALDELDQLDELDELDVTDASSSGESPGTADQVPWRERSFAGNTTYTIDTTENGETIKGETNGQASVLYRQTTVDLNQASQVSWEWKIDHVYHGADEKTRAGDDFPARFYVVVQTGALPWQTKTINYVWASNEPEKTHWLNPYTEDALMLVLNSGDSDAGQWIAHQRDVVADFKRYWKLDVTELSGYAFMVDGDNTGSQGVAWFRDLQFSQQ